MSFQLSRAGAKIALNAVFRASPVYCALLTAAPNDATTLATMAEVTTVGYARQAWTPSVPSDTDPPELHNTNTLTFGPFTGDPPNVTHFAIVDAASGTTGNLLAWGQWDTARDAASGDVLQAGAGAMSITLD